MTTKPYITRTKVLLSARDAGIPVEHASGVTTISGPVTVIMTDAGLSIDGKTVTPEDAYARLGLAA